jgi:ABC-type branched-subunit amino acid transport system substrate-binding protein
MVRAGIAFISASATSPILTGGANPTFLRVVPKLSLQGPQLTRFVVGTLRPKAVTVVSDPGAYSSQLARAMIPLLSLARIPLNHQLVSARAPSFGPLLARATPARSVIILAWQDPARAEVLGRLLLGLKKAVTLVGPDRLYAPGIFTIPGSYVAAPAPDIAQLPSEASLAQRARASIGAFTIAGPPAYAAAHVIDEAVANECHSGETPSRTGLLEAIRDTNQPTSILGEPIRFRGDGDLADARWFLFRIAPGGQYRLLTNR